MKYSSPRAYPRPSHQQDLQELDKTQSKFNRKQVLQKQTKKRFTNITKQDQRICFMSPERINMLLTSSQNSFQSARSPSYRYNSPQFPQEQSLIHNDANQNGKMNDSFLSIYNELNIQKDSEIVNLKAQISRLTQLVEELQKKQKGMKSKEEEMLYLQEYLIKRESDICQIHEKNADLTEKNTKIIKEKQILFKQCQYLRKLFEKQRVKHQSIIKSLEQEIQTLKQQNGNLNNEIAQLKEELKKIENQGMRLYLKQQSLQDIDREDIDSSPEDSLESPKKTAKISNNNFVSTDLAASLKLKVIKPIQPARSSYHQLLSSRSSKILPSRDEEQEQQIHKRSKLSSRKCGCKVIIESLYQKIRYNQIQIDILKRVKSKGESVKIENERLKKQNANLLNRVEYLVERGRKKAPVPRKDSDSSLELSLSPSHKSQRK